MGNQTARRNAVSSRESGLNRRQAFTAAGLVGAGALTAMMPISAAAADTEPAGPEGAWLVDVVDDAPPNTKTQVLYLVTKGGGVAAISDSPPNTGSTGFGAWERTGDNQFRSTFEQFAFDASGKVTGIFRVRTVATIDKTADRMTGRAVLDIQPHGTTQFTLAGTTHFTGTRIKVVPF
jgi:hypothetical protein